MHCTYLWPYIWLQSQRGHGRILLYFLMPNADVMHLK